MLIDFHTHAFPDKIAARAVQSLSENGGGLMPHTDGTVVQLQRVLKEEGVDIGVVHSIATTPKQQQKVNDFAIEVNKLEGLVAFGSVHPDAPDALEELERLKAAGIQGIKLHPQYQGFYADDIRMKPIYRKISQLGFVTLFHAGLDFAYAPPYLCMPDQMLGALKWLDGPVVAAHWGGCDCPLEVLDKLCGEELWFDVSMSYGLIPRPVAQKILDKHTPDKLLFGSDMPWHRPSWELRLLNTLDMSEEDREKILWKNAAGLLGL